MNSWDELRSSRIVAARDALAELTDKGEVSAAFVNWWNQRPKTGNEGSIQVHLHPSTVQLAAQLHVHGLAAAADFATTPWSAEGPIHPGKWIFSILLGEAFVTYFLDGLVSNTWHSQNFYGLETFGAWEAFDHSLRDRLHTDPNGISAVTKRLTQKVARIKENPSGSMSYAARRRGSIDDLIEKYAACPSIEEVWGYPLDDPFFSEDSFLWSVLLEVNPADALVLLGDMPHPIFVRGGLQTDLLAKHTDRLAELLKCAPLAFSDGGAFRAEGAVAVLLLEIATAAVRETAIDSDGSIRFVPQDKPELLTEAAKRCQATTGILLESLFVRPDAIPLAWIWLERLISNGKLSGRWPVVDQSRSGLALNLPMFLIVGLAQRLSWRPDWKEWVGDRQILWRIHRAIAVLAVEAFGKRSDNKRLTEMLEQALIDCDLNYARVADAVLDTMDIVALIGGHAVAALDDPGGWFEATWEKLRPIRERNWNGGEGGRKKNSTAELLVLWGLAAHELLRNNARPGLWMSVEKAVRDARQTDAFGYAPMWTNALLRLFSSFPGDKGSESRQIEREMSKALLPYIAADHAFLVLTTSLVDQGWPIDVVRSAVGVAGFDLKRIVQQFLDMKESVFQLPQSNRQEIDKFRALAKALEDR
jgi:hypothetical protein